MVFIVLAEKRPIDVKRWESFMENVTTNTAEKVRQKLPFKEYIEYVGKEIDKVRALDFSINRNVSLTFAVQKKIDNNLIFLSKKKKQN